MSALTEETMTLVESTAPILQEHGVAITSHFYDQLFRKYPEVRAMFPDSGGLQADRLAGAVLAYSNNIRNLDALTPAVQRIAAIHVDSGVQPEHYPIVGDLLLASMVEVLGEIDGDVLDAWSRAYDALAAIFIETESALVEAP